MARFDSSVWARSEIGRIDGGRHDLDRVFERVGVAGSEDDAEVVRVNHVGGE